MLPREDLGRLIDMRAYAAKAVALMGGRNAQAFADDEVIQLAICRCVEIVGESSHHVSDATRLRLPMLPWMAMYGMRNVLAHEYGRVDLLIVWETVTYHLPGLVAELDRLIPVPDAMA
jgi:uncharacterized protein with HEPN domain